MVLESSPANDNSKESLASGGLQSKLDTEVGDSRKATGKFVPEGGAGKGIVGPADEGGVFKSGESGAQGQKLAFRDERPGTAGSVARDAAVPEGTKTDVQKSDIDLASRLVSLLTNPNYHPEDLKDGVRKGVKDALALFGSTDRATEYLPGEKKFSIPVAQGIKTVMEELGVKSHVITDNGLATGKVTATIQTLMNGSNEGLRTQFGYKTNEKGKLVPYVKGVDVVQLEPKKKPSDLGGEKKTPDLTETLNTMAGTNQVNVIEKPSGNNPNEIVRMQGLIKDRIQERLVEMAAADKAGGGTKLATARHTMVRPSTEALAMPISPSMIPTPIPFEKGPTPILASQGPSRDMPGETSTPVVASDRPSPNRAALPSIVDEVLPEVILTIPPVATPVLAPTDASVSPKTKSKKPS